MNICIISNERGNICVSFYVDHNRLETWFETTIALYSNDNFKGLYKTYTFKTYYAAYNKMLLLQKKHNLY
jgi:hypothetical protein